MRSKYSNLVRNRVLAEGFTLIELLVTVAIISALFAILLPALSKARAVANRIVCKSNLEQIALAWHMYLDNNDGLFYKGLNHNYDFGGWKGRSGALRRPLNEYLSLPLELKSSKGAEIFRCPTDQGSGSNPEMSFLRWGNSYQTNVMLVGPHGLLTSSWVPPPIRQIHRQINKGIGKLKLTDAAEHSRLLLVGDRYWVTQWDPLWQISCGKAWHGHCHRYNLAFLDGHVEYVRICNGLYLAPGYRVQPCRNADSLVYELQEEQPCPCCQELCE
jgi:prepilin-type N-terminal cleavage/methylation domain-containing protein/prepilin-type processing-associated H-X9-DG protein